MLGSHAAYDGQSAAVAQSIAGSSPLATQQQRRETVVDDGAAHVEAALLWAEQDAPDWYGAELSELAL